MNVAQNLIFVTSLYLFWAINDPIFKLMMLSESGTFLNNHVSCNLF